MEEPLSDWEETVKRILELGKVEGDNNKLMRQLGQLSGSYWLGLLDAGLSMEQATWPFYNFLISIAKARKERLI